MVVIGVGLWVRGVRVPRQGRGDVFVPKKVVLGRPQNVLNKREPKVLHAIQVGEFFAVKDRQRAVVGFGLPSHELGATARVLK